MRLRPATASDLEAVAAIYGDAVSNGTASFELDPPDVAEMTRRWQAVTDGGYPYLVAERDGVVVGYAYAGPYRARAAYRATCEDSIYIAPAAHRTGVGRALLTAIIADCGTRGFRQMIAGVSGGDASIALHETLGFTRVGVLRSVGFKLGRWIDVVLLQRALGPGDSSPLP